MLIDSPSFASIRYGRSMTISRSLPTCSSTPASSIAWQNSTAEPSIIGTSPCTLTSEIGDAVAVHHREEMLDGADGKALGAQRGRVAGRADVVEMGRQRDVAGNAGEQNSAVGRQRVKNQPGLHSRVESLSRRHNAFFQSLLLDASAARRRFSASAAAWRRALRARRWRISVRAASRLSPSARCTVSSKSIQGNRLLDEIEGAELGRRHRSMNIAVARNHHHVDLRLLALDLLEQTDAVDLRHPNIQQHQLGLFLLIISSTRVPSAVSTTR